MMNQIRTIRGTVAIWNDLVSLTDMFEAVGKTLNKANPIDWAEFSGVVVLGDAVECFAPSPVALRYALYLSPTLHAELCGHLNFEPSPREVCQDQNLINLANQSRLSFSKAVQKLGFIESKHFYKLTNHLYSKALTSNVNSLRAQLMLKPTDSIRKHLDTASLSLVVATESLFVCRTPGLVDPSFAQIIKLISDCSELAKASSHIQTQAVH